MNDRLDVHEVVHTKVAQLLAVPAVLDPSPRRLDPTGLGAVDPHNADLEGLGHSLAAPNVVRADRTPKPIRRVIRQPHSFLLGLKLDHRKHRTEDLLVPDPHRRLSQEDGWGHEETLLRGVLGLIQASSDKHTTFVNTCLDVTPDFFVL